MYNLVERHKIRSTAILYLILISSNRETSTSSQIHDHALYTSIDAEVYGEVAYYWGPDFVIQDCVETYLNDVSSRFVELVLPEVPPVNCFHGDPPDLVTLWRCVQTVFY